MFEKYLQVLKKAVPLQPQTRNARMHNKRSLEQ